MWNPEKYNQNSGLQIRDAKEMIQNIVRECHCDSIHLIVDVGCGTGQVTKMLSDNFPKAKILAFDIQPQMIEYAQSNYSCERISYFQDDIGRPWNELTDLLQNVEGHVNLVWSNIVLHWVKDKETAIINIFRLLKKQGGKCYLNIAIPRDISATLTRKEREENEKYFKITPESQQLKRWSEYLGKCNWKFMAIHNVLSEWEYKDSSEWFRMLDSIQSVVLSTYTSSNKGTKGELMEKFHDLFVKAFSVKPGDSLPESVPINPTKWIYRHLYVTASK